MLQAAAADSHSSRDAVSSNWLQYSEGEWPLVCCELGAYKLARAVLNSCAPKLLLPPVWEFDPNVSLLSVRLRHCGQWPSLCLQLNNGVQPLRATTLRAHYDKMFDQLPDLKRQ